MTEIPVQPAQHDVAAPEVDERCVCSGTCTVRPVASRRFVTATTKCPSHPRPMFLAQLVVGEMPEMLVPEMPIEGRGHWHHSIGAACGTVEDGQSNGQAH